MSPFGESKSGRESKSGPANIDAGREEKEPEAKGPLAGNFWRAGESISGFGAEGDPVEASIVSLVNSALRIYATDCEYLTVENNIEPSLLVDPSFPRVDERLSIGRATRDGSSSELRTGIACRFKLVERRLTALGGKGQS